MSEITSKKRKLSLPLVLAGSVSSLVLALGMSPTFSAFTAQITNETNNTSAGTLIMEESTIPVTTTCKSTDGGNVTSNAATCSTINKYGGANLAPGGTTTTTVIIKNSGNLTPASFSLTPGSCTPADLVSGSAVDICDRMTLILTQDGTQIYSGPLSTFGPAAKVLTPVAGNNGTSTFTFLITFGDTTLGNTYQGLTANQSLVWKFQS